MMSKSTVKKWEREAGGFIAVERRRDEDAKLVRNRLMWVACLPLSHGDIRAQTAAEGHVCVHSPTAARVCVSVCGSYYHRNHALKSKGSAELAPPFAGPARDGPASQGRTGPTLETAPPLTMGMGELAPVARTLKS